MGGGEGRGGGRQRRVPNLKGELEVLGYCEGLKFPHQGLLSQISNFLVR